MRAVKIEGSFPTKRATQIVGPSFGRSLLEGLDGELHIVVALVALLIFAQEQLDRRVGEGLGELMKGATGRVGRPGVEATLERSTDRVQIAVTRGREDPVAAALVDGGLEVPPAGEAVLAGR